MQIVFSVYCLVNDDMNREGFFFLFLGSFETGWLNLWYEACECWIILRVGIWGRSYSPPTHTQSNVTNKGQSIRVDVRADQDRGDTVWPQTWRLNSVKLLVFVKPVYRWNVILIKIHEKGLNRMRWVISKTYMDEGDILSSQYITMQNCQNQRICPN